MQDSYSFIIHVTGMMDKRNTRTYKIIMAVKMEDTL
jgi:hypothetical protein